MYLFVTVYVSLRVHYSVYIFTYVSLLCSQVYDCASIAMFSVVCMCMINLCTYECECVRMTKPRFRARLLDARVGASVTQEHFKIRRR